MLVSTVPALLAALQLGGTITLADAPWPDIVLKDIPAGAPAVTLDASQAHVPGLTFENVHGVALVGGEYGSGGVLIDKSGDISLTGGHVTAPKSAGVRVVFSEHVKVSGTRVDGSLKGCFAYRGSSWVTFDKIQCSGSAPDSLTHPDFVQSRASTGQTLDAPSHHIWITNGTASGDTNGIVSFARTGPADTDVHVIGNTLSLRRINCITFSFVVGGEIRDNHCIALPDAKFGRVTITTPGSTGISQSGNVISR
jgi:hypothetical protein